MVRRDNTSGRSDKEICVGVFASNLDVGFISCLPRVYRRFEFHIECMAVRSSVFCIIKNGLIRGLEFKDILKNKGCFSGGDA